GNGFSASIDIEDGFVGRGKFVYNTSTAATFGPAALSATGVAGVTVNPDSLRNQQPDLAANIRVDQAWGSAQIMAALHNASGGYYSNNPGLLGLNGIPPGVAGAPGNQVFGHPGEAFGVAVGAGAKFVNFLLPRDSLEFQVNACHGAITGYCVSGLYNSNFVYG